MLKLIHGEDTPKTPLGLGDLPLGPWAGATLQVWATKSGTRWHADPECRSMKTRVRTKEFVQPTSGTLADRTLPDGLHCDPPDTLGDYLEAARRLVRLSNETDEAEDEWADGNIPVGSLRTGIRWGKQRVHELLTTEPLAAVTAGEIRRREELVEKVCHVVSANDERLAVMVLADWVRRGRTPREHKPHYDRFVEIAAQLFDAAEITTYMGMNYLINRDSLPTWLRSIAAGTSCESATAELAEKEYAQSRSVRRSEGGDFPEQVRDTWLAAGARWRFMLESMAVAHPGRVLALFENYGSGVDHELLDLCARIGPSAHVRVAHLDWTIATVPAACRLSFVSTEAGPGGLVLMDEVHYRVDDDTCGLFLRNLFSMLGSPSLSQYVRFGSAESDERDHPEPAEDDWQMATTIGHRGFNATGLGYGVSLSDCLPALQEALHGEGLPRPTTTRKRRPRS